MLVALLRVVAYGGILLLGIAGVVAMQFTAGVFGVAIVGVAAAALFGLASLDGWWHAETRQRRRRVFRRVVAIAAALGVLVIAFCVWMWGYWRGARELQRRVFARMRVEAMAGNPNTEDSVSAGWLAPGSHVRFYGPYTSASDVEARTGLKVATRARVWRFLFWDDLNDGPRNHYMSVDDGAVVHTIFWR